MTGVSEYGLPGLEPEQYALLDALDAAYHPDLCVREPFPYHPRALFLRLGTPTLPHISLRNLWQHVLTRAASERYGRDIAACIVSRVGVPAPGADLLLMVGSTGASMAMAAAPHLKNALRCRLRIVAVGGVFGATHNHDAVDHIMQFVGDADIWVRAANATLRGFSPDATIRTGPHRHFGDEGYFGWAQQDTIRNIINAVTNFPEE